MRITLFLAILILGCNSNSKNEKVENLEKEIYQTKNYFDFNKVDYYSGNFDISDAYESLENFGKKVSDLDSIKFGILGGQIPKNINDQYFIEKLEEIGFTKNELDSAAKGELDKIFSDNKKEKTEFNACLPIFRDILIFKKDEKIVGIAKICFECDQHKIYGSRYNTTSFGENGEFHKLKKILKDEN